MLACRFFAVLRETLAVCTAVLTPRSLALVEENRRCSTSTVKTPPWSTRDRSRAEITLASERGDAIHAARLFSDNKRLTYPRACVAALLSLKWRAASLESAASRSRGLSRWRRQTWSPSNTVTSSLSATGTATPTASQTASATATATRTSSPSTTPLPCPLRLFPSNDVIGTVLSKSFQPDEASCMLQCCNVADLCVGYSFQEGILGVQTNGQTTTVSTTSTGTIDSSGITCGVAPIPIMVNSSQTRNIVRNSWDASQAGTEYTAVRAAAPPTRTVTCTYGDIGVPCYACKDGITTPDGTVARAEWYNGGGCGSSVILGQTVSLTVVGCQDPPFTCGNDALTMNWVGRYTCTLNRTAPIISQSWRPPALVSSGVVSVAPQTTQTARCVLLSNISQLIPSNGWSGGIKLSALGS